MSYDINEYTDDQCFEMLDLNNHSDRELEMKILHQMDNYAKKSKRLYQFFEQMYDRFFADDEEDENMVEGFTTETQDDRTVVVTNKTENIQQTRPGGAAEITTNLPT